MPPQCGGHHYRRSEAVFRPCAAQRYERVVERLVAVRPDEPPRAGQAASAGPAACPAHPASGRVRSCTVAGLRAAGRRNGLLGAARVGQ